MASNQLIVTVFSTRNLHFNKSHPNLRVSIAITLINNNKSNNQKYRVQTDIVHTNNGSATFDQRCEFLIPSIESSLNIVVHNKTKFGLDDQIGQLIIDIGDLYSGKINCKSPQWFALKGRKSDKNKGEMMLSFELNRTKYSTNTLPNQHSKLSSPESIKLTTDNDDMIMVNHHQLSTIDDVVVLSSRRRSSLPNLFDEIVVNTETPPNSHRKSTISNLSNSFRKLIRTTTPRRASQCNTNDNVIGSSMNDVFNSNLSLFANSTLVTPSRRHKSEIHPDLDDISSGVGTMSRLSALDQIDKSFSNLYNVYMYLTKEDLVSILKEQRRQAINNERELRDTRDYLDRLLYKVMNSNPEILQNLALSTRNNRHRQALSYRF